MPRDQCRVLLQGVRQLHGVPEGGPEAGAGGGIPVTGRAGKGVRFRFKLSKISRVNIVVRSESGRTYLGTGATFSRRSLLPLGPARCEAGADV